MVLTKRTSIAGATRLILLSCVLVGGAALTASAPARAGLLNDMWNSDNSTTADKPADSPDDSQPQPQRGLFNRLFDSDKPAAPAAPTAPAAPAGHAAAAPAAAPAAAADDDGDSERQPGLWSRMFGSRDSDSDKVSDDAPAAQQPGMLDKAMGSVGLGGSSEASKIDYSERSKLAVPQREDLPPPRDSAQPRAIRRNTSDASLVRPPADYLQKVRGADGKATGLRPEDNPKKRFFGIF